jgi:hypothetical protein
MLSDLVRLVVRTLRRLQAWRRHQPADFVSEAWRTDHFDDPGGVR